MRCVGSNWANRFNDGSTVSKYAELENETRVLLTGGRGFNDDSTVRKYAWLNGMSATYRATRQR